MNEDQIKWIVGGIVLLVVIRKIDGLFSSPASKERQQQDRATRQQAGVFSSPSDMPELWKAQPLTDALVAGSVTVAQVGASQVYAGRIDQARERYRNAKGILYDNEGEAVSAIASMPNYVCLLALGQNFYNNYAITLGALGVTFLETADMARIANIVTQLRTQ